MQMNYTKNMINFYQVKYLQVIVSPHQREKVVFQHLRYSIHPSFSGNIPKKCTVRSLSVLYLCGVQKCTQFILSIKYINVCHQFLSFHRIILKRIFLFDNVYTKLGKKSVC